jgi:hypothetical protein
MKRRRITVPVRSPPTWERPTKAKRYTEEQIIRVLRETGAGAKTKRLWAANTPSHKPLG